MNGVGRTSPDLDISDFFNEVKNNLIKLLEDDGHSSVYWVKREKIISEGCNDESEFFNEFLPPILEIIELQTSKDLEEIKKRLQGKIQIIGRDSPSW
jgi:hypothetical protein